MGNPKKPADWAKIKPANQEAAYNEVCEQLSETSSALATANKELATAEKLIEELQAKVQNAEANTGDSGHVVSLGKKQYEFTISRFSLNGVEMDAKEVEDNSEVLKELVEMGFGGLKELE